MRPKTKWHGDWRFVSIIHPLHGSTGSSTVLALEDKEAQREIARAGSKELFGTDIRRSDMRVSNIRQAPFESYP